MGGNQPDRESVRSAIDEFDRIAEKLTGQSHQGTWDQPIAKAHTLSLEKDQDFAQLVEKVERADTIFGRDLWLIAERILLRRLTRTSDRGSQLNSILQAIRTITTESEHIQSSETESQNAQVPNLAKSFSLLVEMLEGMQSEELYKLIALLRNDTSDVTGPSVESIPKEDDGRSDDKIAHTICCLSRSGFRSMHKILYDKFGADASARLYTVGEAYGKRIASVFKEKGLTLRKTIRQFERTTQIAGWGEIHLQRLSEDEVECVIKDTMFSFSGQGMKRSCYFAAGILGGIMSGMLDQHFSATEIECVTCGADSCMFKISRDEIKNSHSGSKQPGQ